MKNLYLIPLIVFSACSPAPSDDPDAGEMETPCNSDMDCRNGFHCNLYFELCEPNILDAGQDPEASILLDGGTDSGLMIDSGPPDSGLIDSGPPPDYCIDFDGTDHVSIPSDIRFAFDRSQEFAIDVWVRPTLPDGMIFYRYVPDDISDYSIFLSLEDDHVRFHVEGESILSDFSVSSSEWNHIIAVFDGGEISISMILNDGEIVSNVRTTGRAIHWTTATTLISEMEIYLGMDNQEMRRFSGQLDSLRLYSDTTEMSSDSLVGEWTFNDMTFDDSSGNGFAAINHGTEWSVR